MRPDRDLENGERSAKGSEKSYFPRVNAEHHLLKESGTISSLVYRRSITQGNELSTRRNCNDEKVRQSFILRRVVFHGAFWNIVLLLESQ